MDCVISRTSHGRDRAMWRWPFPVCTVFSITRGPPVYVFRISFLLFCQFPFPFIIFVNSFVLFFFLLFVLFYSFSLRFFLSFLFLSFTFFSLSTRYSWVFLMVATCRTWWWQCIICMIPWLTAWYFIPVCWQH